MALKDDLRAIKTQLSSEEQFIENFIKGERFIKKYKLLFISLIVILIVGFVVSFIMHTVKQKNIEESNMLYTQLIFDSNNTTKIQKLKESNPNLYAIFLLHQLNNHPQNSQILSEFDSLSKNSDLNPLLQNILALNTQGKSSFLKDYNKILQAYKLLQENKIEEANILLSQIKFDSALGQIAKNFQHYKGISQ